MRGGEIPVPKSNETRSSSKTNRWTVLNKGSGRHFATYADCDSKVLLDAVYAVTQVGDAITFGLTSDGGAFYVGILSSGDLTRFYLDSLERLEDTLQGLVLAVKD